MSASGVVFRERLWPGISFIAGGLAFGAAIGLVLWVINPLLGLLAGGLAGAAIVIVMFSASSLVLVDLGQPEQSEDPVLVAGKARIEANHLGAVAVLAEPQLRAVMGPEADARAYVCHRPWVKQGVRVVITDPHDPTPYWLVASRRPKALARAVAQAAQAAHSEHTSWPPSS